MNFFSVYLILSVSLGPGVTQPVTEMSIRNRKIVFLWSRARPVPKAESLTAICEPIVYTMWDLQHLTTVEASTACYGDSFGPTTSHE
jgi:hypothetical protein